MVQEHKRARSLYLELAALGLELRICEDLDGPAGYNVAVKGLQSLSQRHADRIKRRVEAGRAGLLEVLRNRWDPDLVAIQREGET